MKSLRDFDLNLLVPHLDVTVNHEGWEARDKVGALALSTVHEGVLCALLLEVVLLLGAPRARVRAVHGHAWTAWGLVLLWWHHLSLASHAGVGDVVALGAQPPLVDVKGENADDHSECDTHNNRIAIHPYGLYCTIGKRNQDGGAGGELFSMNGAFITMVFLSAGIVVTDGSASIRAISRFTRSSIATPARPVNVS